MSARRFPISRAAYRLLRRGYPAAFRARFARDLDLDFAELLAAHGAARAWARLLPDLVRSVLATRADARRAHIRGQTPYQGDGPMGSLLFDLRHAARTLLKAPVFTAVTVLTLALGIGANSAMFSLVNAALLRPLGFDDADRLVMIHEGIPQAGMPKIPASAPDIIDLRQHQRSFEAIAAYAERAVELSGRGAPERLMAVRVEAGLFPLLRADPSVGRSFLVEEDSPGRDVAVLGYALWQRLFAGRPDAVGSVIHLDRRPFTIVGVMPASFEFPKRGPIFNGTPADLWIPMAWSEFQRTARGSMFNNSVLARLKPGITLEQARAELQVLAPRIRENYPQILRERAFDLTVQATPFREEIAGTIRTPLLVLFAAVGLVLLVACANVANLILSRAASRRRELHVRLALGAPRTRLLQLLLGESLLLASAGGLLGLAAGRAVLAAVPAVLASSLPGLQDVALDVRVVAFTVATSVLTAVVFGVVPMFTADRDVAAPLHEGSGRTIAGGRQVRVQQVLVTATVTLAMVLLVGAGLLVRSFTALVATDPGFRPDQVLSLSVSLPIEGYRRGADVASFIRSLHDRIASIPGVRSVSISTDVPLESNERRVMTPDSPLAGDLPPSVALTWTYGDYFGTLGVPIRSGRAFSRTEDEAFRPVAIVSESLAQRFWPGEESVGKRIASGLGPRATWLTIVGVAGDVHDGPLGSDPTIHVYVPFPHLAPDLDRLADTGSPFGRTLRAAMLARGEAAGLVAPARGEVAALDPALPVTRVTTMEQQVSESVAPQSFSTMVLAGFAGGALLLAAIGLYGVLAFGVAQRTREIGVRIALGATRASVVGMVIRQGMALVAVGLILGLAAAAGATRVMRSLLYETTPHDPWTFAAAPAVLVAVALLACWLPARRAARVEPIVALRTE